uniref:Beta/gamma crystallin 'Greek key' domain-containing protein n=1 Tax=Gopherus evgoodei TaxID=1825980 RepID=A0A8C4W6S7_9SAUR
WSSWHSGTPPPAVQPGQECGESQAVRPKGLDLTCLEPAPEPALGLPCPAQSHGGPCWIPARGLQGTSSPRIVIYEHADFEGLSREFTSDVPDLHELDFGDCICSLRVVGQPWIAYTAPKYEGDAYALEEGEYRTVEKNKAFSALRPAEQQCPAQPGVNKIVVYEHADFEGLSREFTSDVPDLHELDFGDCICSLRVVGQPWIAYTAPKYEGDAYALEEGEYRTVEKNKAFSALRLGDWGEGGGERG